MAPSRSHLLALVGSVVAAVALTCAPTDGMTFSNDAVAVLPAAGTDDADVYSLTGTANNLQAERVGRRRLLTDTLGPSAFTDLKILPGGGSLLADFDDRGFATTTETGALDFSLASPGDRPGIRAASVVGYDSSSEPVRFLYTDNNRQRIIIHDASAGADLWTRPVVDPPVPAEIIQVIALPDRRIAVAVNWPTLRTSGVDVIDLGGDTLGRTLVRFAGEPHPESPENTTIIDGLTGLRDLFGLDDDTLLVTGRRQLLVLSISEQKVLHRLDLSERDDLAGEFVAARGLPSGRIAAATAEPGLWTRPHDNHRVLWLDDTLDDVVARTDPLSRAPWRVEPADGHGGSGSLGLTPDLSYVPTGDLDDLSFSTPLRVHPVPVRQGGTGEASISIANPTRRPIYLERAAITAAPGSCDDDIEGRTFAESLDLVLKPSNATTVESAFALDPEAPTGEWCARLEFEDRAGNTRVETREAAFSVIAQGGDVRRRTGRRVEPVDLGLNTGDIGTGEPDTGGPFDDLPTDPVGCGCRATRPHPPGWLALLALGLLGGALRRRR